MSGLPEQISISRSHLNNSQIDDITQQINSWVISTLEANCTNKKDANSVMHAVKQLCLYVLNEKIHLSYYQDIGFALSSVLNGGYNTQFIKELYGTLPYSHCNGISNPLLGCMSGECYFGPYAGNKESTSCECDRALNGCKVSVNTITFMANLGITA